MDKNDEIRGYEQTLIAIKALNDLRDAIHIMRYGCGISFPTNTDDYIARIHRWLLEEKDMLEHALGLMIE